MKLYTHIFLDADETIFDFEKAEAVALANCFAEFNLELTPQIEALYQDINKRLWKELEEGLVDQIQLRYLRFQRLFEQCQLESDPKLFAERYLYYLGQGNYLLEGAEELCEYLHNRYQIVILTNGIKEVQHARIGSSKIMPYVSQVIVSEDTGYAKPDPRIYEYACEKAGVADKAQIIMVGDSLSSDMLGGIQFGIDTLWVNLNHQENKNQLAITYEVNTLEAVKTIL